VDESERSEAWRSIGIVAAAFVGLALIVFLVSLAVLGTDAFKARGTYAGQESSKESSSYAGQEPASAAKQKPTNTELSSEERNYLYFLHDAAAPLKVWEDRQVELYKQCDSFCTLATQDEMAQNTLNVKGVSGDIQNTKPPRGYEQAHQSVIRAFSLTSELMGDLLLHAISASQANNMINQANAYAQEAEDEWPQRARDYMDALPPGYDPSLTPKGGATGPVMPPRLSNGH
jgi:hypothetical protein